MGKYLQEHVEAIRKAELEYEDVLQELQASCKHETVLVQIVSGAFGTMLYYRICEDCGVEEAGEHPEVLVVRPYFVDSVEFHGAKPFATRAWKESS